MAWDAVAACVTTPAFTSAVSDAPEAAPEPITVIEGAGSSPQAMDAAVRSTHVVRATAMGPRMPSG